MSYSLEPIYEMYVYETRSLLIDFELEILEGNVYQRFTENNFEKIYTILQKINGAARMMLYVSISTVANSTEDLIYYMKKEKVEDYNFRELALLLFEVSEFIRNEVLHIIKHVESWKNPMELDKKICNQFQKIYRKNNIQSIHE